jgi:hypothetical protein
MADSPISGLDAGGTAQADDYLMVNDAGVWKGVTIDQIEALILRDDNVDTAEIAANAVTTAKIKFDIDAEAKAFDADFLDGQHAAALALGGGNIPINGVIMWAGAIVDLPDNWQLADGTNGTEDYRDRFLVGAGAAYAVGAVGGADSSNYLHTHALGTLATGNSSSHRHFMPYGLFCDTAGALLVWHKGIGAGEYTNYAGIHNHNIAGNPANDGDATQENRPLFYALAFVERMS